MASQMEPCPECQTLLEPWEVTCHNCGNVVSMAAVPIVPEVPAEANVLEEAFQNWFSEGKVDFEQGRYEDAAVDFKEALKRVRGLDRSVEKELEVRKYLAESLEKDEKLAEAAQQYVILADKVASNDLKAQHSKDADRLKAASAELADLAGDQSEDTFYVLEGDERKFVPLYCGGCKRLLSEGIVFGFRRRRVDVLRCFCEFEGEPVAKHDAVYRSAVREVQGYRNRKSLVLKAASQKFPNARDKVVAGLLAIFLGNFGIHKWYLGERSACFVYMLFCWTFIPWIVAFFEAVQYFTMSQVSWNLAYNVDHVLASVPAGPEEEPGAPHEVFSMDIIDDPEDVIDELTGQEYEGKKGIKVTDETDRS